MSTLTIHQVAAAEAVSDRTVEAWIATGELRAYSVSRSASSRKPRVRIRQADLDAFRERRAIVLAGGKPAMRTRLERRPTVPAYI